MKMHHPQIMNEKLTNFEFYESKFSHILCHDNNNNNYRVQCILTEKSQIFGDSVKFIKQINMI